MSAKPGFVRSRLTGFLCAAVATAISIMYFVLGGAPVRYRAVNLIALILGSAFLVLVDADRWRPQTSGMICIAIGMLLVAVSIWGKSANGATRWLLVGGLSFEPSMIFLPFSTLLFARNHNAYSAVGLMLAAAATAMEPDRSMAGALSLGLLALLTLERNSWVLVTWVAAAGAFASTLLREDSVPPAPFVERVFVSAFALNPALGVAVVAGAVILLLPALRGLLGRSKQTGIYAALAEYGRACWQQQLWATIPRRWLVMEAARFLAIC